MAYRISFLKRSKVIGAKLWPCSLEAAAAHALAQFSQQHLKHGVTSVTVTNERTGNVVFEFASDACSPVERRRIELGLAPRVDLNFKEEPSASQ
jgi:hypothetical protein